MAYSLATLFGATLLICSLCNLVSSNITFFNTKMFECFQTSNASISYQNNVNLLYSNFDSASSSNFYNYTNAGDIPDKVYGYHMCRGDVSLQVCHSCILDGIKLAQNANCKYQDGAFFADECMFRYSNRSTYGTLEKELGLSVGPHGDQVVSNPQEYNQTLSAVLQSVISEAAFGGGPKPGFATNETKVTKDETIYSLAQCTPDIVGSNCSRCLTNGVSVFRKDVTVYNGNSYKVPNCQLIYANKSLTHSKGDQLMPSSTMLALCSFLMLVFSMLY